MMNAIRKSLQSIGALLKRMGGLFVDDSKRELIDHLRGEIAYLRKDNLRLQGDKDRLKDEIVDILKPKEVERAELSPEQTNTVPGFMTFSQKRRVAQQLLNLESEAKTREAVKRYEETGTVEEGENGRPDSN